MAWRGTGKAQKHLREVVLKFDGDTCLPWPFARDVNGYGRVAHEGRSWVTSRLVCQLTHGDAPSPKHEAAHSCGHGDLGCVNPRHVRWATRVENKADELTHGVHSRGARNGMAKLTDEQVAAIRARSGVIHRQLAAEFGVSRQCIGRVRLGDTYNVGR